jgi:hypothetical protein
MQPRHWIALVVSAAVTAAGAAIDVYGSIRLFLPGLLAWGLGVFMLALAIESAAGYVLWRRAMRRRGLDPVHPDRKPRPVPRTVTTPSKQPPNGTLVFDRPAVFTPGRAALPQMARTSRCGCPLDPASGRVQHTRRCGYRGGHWPDTVQRIDPAMTVIDIEPVEAAP